MNKREKILGGASLLLILALILYQFGFSEVFDSFSLDSAELNNLKETYEKYQEYMKKEDQIRTKYYDIVGKDRNPTDSDQDPQKEFSEFVSDLCKRLDFKYPRIDPPSLVPIDNVNDYVFVTLNVNANGDIQSVSKLLKGFDREAVLIRELTLRSRLDNPELSMTITVARMIQIDSPQNSADKTPSKGSRDKFVSPTMSRTPRRAIQENEE